MDELILPRSQWLENVDLFGTEGRNRTDTPVKEPDFESQLEGEFRFSSSEAYIGKSM